MSKKFTKVEQMEFSSLALEGAEKLTDLIGSAVHALHVIGSLVPPVALFLEGVAMLAEMKKSPKEESKISLADKGAKVLVVSLVLSISLIVRLSTPCVNSISFTLRSNNLRGKNNGDIAISGVNANVTFASISAFKSLASLHIFGTSHNPGSVSVKSNRILRLSPCA